MKYIGLLGIFIGSLVGSRLWGTGDHIWDYTIGIIIGSVGFYMFFNGLKDEIVEAIKQHIDSKK